MGDIKNQNDLKNELAIPEESNQIGEDNTGQTLRFIDCYANGRENSLGRRSERFAVREETSDSGDVSSGWDIFEWQAVSDSVLEVVRRPEELSVTLSTRIQKNYIRTWINFGWVNEFYKLIRRKEAGCNIRWVRIRLRSTRMVRRRANNSSGMCGVKQNTYHTLEDIELCLWTGRFWIPRIRRLEKFLENAPDLCAKVSNNEKRSGC